MKNNLCLKCGCDRTVVADCLTDPLTPENQASAITLIEGCAECMEVFGFDVVEGMGLCRVIQGKITFPVK